MAVIVPDCAAQLVDWVREYVMFITRLPKELGVICPVKMYTLPGHPATAGAAVITPDDDTDPVLVSIPPVLPSVLPV